MMFDFPCVIDAKLVGELDLIERLLKKPELVALVPRPRKLMFVENPEFHWASRRGSLLAKVSGLAGRVVVISPSSSAVASRPLKKSSADIARLLVFTVAPSASTAAGKSAAGSLFAIEPPMVPR